MARSKGRVVGLVLLVAVAGLALWLWRGRARQVAEMAGGGAGPRRPSLFAADPELDRSLPAGALEGIVLGPEGRGLPGATVVLVRTRARDAASGGDMGRPLALAKAGAGGVFRFETLSPGSYALSAMAERHTPAGQGPIVLAPGEHRRIELRLASGGILLSGRVLDVGGGPIPGARVRALEFSPMVGNTFVPRVYQALADEAGVYEMYLGRAQYSLIGEADGYAPGHDWFMLARETTRDLRLSPASRIAGRVIERESRNPVSDAELWLQPHRAGGARPRDVKSDAAGQFAFNDLEPGTYRVGARRGRLVGLSASVSVAMAQGVSDVEVEVTPGFVVAGKVIAPDGKGLAGARVQLAKDRPPFERPMIARSGPDGAYRIEGVLPSGFRLEVAADGHARAQQELLVTADVPDLRVKLEPGAVVKGRVTSAEGKPIEGALINLQVRARDRAMMVGGVFERATTAADGSFEIAGLPAGDLRLTAQHPAHGIAEVKDDKLAGAEQKTVALKLAAGATIAGSVTLDDGKPAAGARVEGMMMGGAGRWSDVTAADGSYKLTGVSSGSVIVVGTLGRGMSWGGRDRPDQKTVKVAEGEHKTGVDLIVAGGKVVSGVVRGPDGKPVSGAEVSASPDRDGRSSRVGGSGARAFSGPDGTFTLEQLGAGQYTVWAVQAGFADAEALHVDGGTTGLALQFAPESTIAGVVTGPDGKPVRDYTITLTAAPRTNETPEQQRARQFASPWESPTDTVHDPSGRFFFPRVGAGTHELQVKTTEGSAGRLAVTVGAGEQKSGVRLVIERGGRIVGKVVDRETDAPLAGVDVRAFATSAMGNRPGTRTSASGAFAIEGINPGETLSLMITGDASTHLVERRRVEMTKGAEIDLGTIKLARGNIEARIKEGTWNGFTGINPSENDTATVLNARPGTPAALAGIKDGDAILSIDGKDMRGAGFGTIEYSLRGRPGSPISLVVQTPGAPPRTVTFNRFDAQAPPPAAPRPATASK